MISEFVGQVQTLMEIQQIKLAEEENFFRNTKYYWLSSRKITLIKLSFRHENKIRQALTKASLDQQIEILRKLIKWLNDNPKVEVLKIPEMTLDLINNTIMVTLLNQANFSRMTSFRNSLRRLSILSNKIAPSAHCPVDKTRSVTFKDQPVIYKIS